MSGFCSTLFDASLLSTFKAAGNGGSFLGGGNSFKFITIFYVKGAGNHVFRFLRHMLDSVSAHGQ
jgi:hypothetical protein